MIFTLVHTLTFAHADGDAASGVTPGHVSAISKSLNATKFQSIQAEIWDLPCCALDEASAGKTGTHCVSDCPMSVAAATWLFGIPAVQIFSTRNQTNFFNHSVSLFRPPIS